jgi:cell division protein FtsI (penicillin-binding protein 3)
MARSTIRKNERTLWDEDLGKSRLERSKKRAQVIQIILLFCFFAILVRLVTLMVFDHEELNNRAERQYKRIKTLQPHRGVIWDSNMRQLAVNVETKSLYAVPSQIHDIQNLVSQIAPRLGMLKAALKKKLQSNQDKDFVWIKRKMSEEMFVSVKKVIDSEKANQLGVLTETKRFYPKGKVASHIIGHTNIDNKGLDGIELQYDDIIRGEAKKVLLGRDARGYGLFKGVENGSPGNNLLLTIDEDIQYIVERELKEAMSRWKAEASIAIMMNPATGAILAMATKPTYDANSAGSVKAAKRRNRAITDIYEPGSTFKAFLASAALEEGFVTLDEEFDVSKGFIRVPGGRIRDVHRNEVLTFKDIIKKSSNVGAVQVGLKIGAETYYSYIKRFGFGEKTGIDLRGEVKGLLRSTEKWSGRSLASLSIGQEIGVTPLQVLRAYAAIANGGKLMRPYIVSSITSPSGSSIKTFSPHVQRRVISERTAEIMREILKSVVEEGGTARKAFIRGNQVAGKTGTAQMVDPETGLYSKSDYVSSFAGFVPADNPAVALIVVVYKPRGARYGGVVAAPVFRNIIERTLMRLDVPMEREDRNILLVNTSR